MTVAMEMGTGTNRSVRSLCQASGNRDVRHDRPGPNTGDSYEIMLGKREVMHQVAEPLSAHQGHGSTKQRGPRSYPAITNGVPSAAIHGVRAMSAIGRIVGAPAMSGRLRNR